MFLCVFGVVKTQTCFEPALVAVGTRGTRPAAALLCRLCCCALVAVRTRGTRASAACAALLHRALAPVWTRGTRPGARRAVKAVHRARGHRRECVEASLAPLWCRECWNKGCCAPFHLSVSCNCNQQSPSVLQSFDGKRRKKKKHTGDGLFFSFFSSSFCVLFLFLLFLTD